MKATDAYVSDLQGIAAYASKVKHIYAMILIAFLLFCIFMVIAIKVRKLIKYNRCREIRVRERRHQYMLGKKETVIANASVRLRDDPSIHSKTLTTIPKGTKLLAIKYDKWYLISYKRHIGYAFSKLFIPYDDEFYYE